VRRWFALWLSLALIAALLHPRFGGGFGNADDLREPPSSDPQAAVLGGDAIGALVSVGAEGDDDDRTTPERGSASIVPPLDALPRTVALASDASPRSALLDARSMIRRLRTVRATLPSDHDTA
jgi:hypothetical protein